MSDQEGVQPKAASPREEPRAVRVARGCLDGTFGAWDDEVVIRDLLAEYDALSRPPVKAASPEGEADDLTKPYRPVAIHFEESDTLQYVSRDEPTFSQPVHAGLDVLLTMESREPIGWCIYGWSKIAPATPPRAEVVADGIDSFADLHAKAAPQPEPVAGEWVTVPREATVNMMAAYCRQMNCGTQEVGEHDEAGRYQAAAYRAMIAAAPQAPAVADKAGVAESDIPALLRVAIRRLEAYDAPSRPAMLDLASHLRGVLEIPHEAEDAVRQCASIDANGYIAEKAAIIAALRAASINAALAQTSPNPVGVSAQVVGEIAEVAKIARLHLSGFPDHGAADGVAVYNVKLNGAQLNALAALSAAEGGEL